MPKKGKKKYGIAASYGKLNPLCGIKIINYFSDILKTVEAKQVEVMEKKFDALLEYMGVHFTYEEELMKKSEYPEYAKHKAEHGEMREKMSNIKNLYSGV